MATRRFYDQRSHWVRDLDLADRRIYLEILLRRVFCHVCQAVKRERLDWLADNPRYTKRFAFTVGRRCRLMTVKDVAEEMNLNWRTVKDLDKLYMAEQLRQAGEPSPKSRSGRGTATELWSATWKNGERSGLEEATAPKRAWTSSTSGWGPEKAGKFGWP